MNRITTCLAAFALLFMTQCKPADEGFKIKFDSSKEISGKKFAIRDINPDLPRNWDEYNYVVLEFKITTSQRFHVGFTTNYGSWVLPDFWNTEDVWEGYGWLRPSSASGNASII